MCAVSMQGVNGGNSPDWEGRAGADVESIIFGMWLARPDHPAGILASFRYPRLKGGMWCAVSL